MSDGFLFFNHSSGSKLNPIIFSALLMEASIEHRQDYIQRQPSAKPTQSIVLVCSLNAWLADDSLLLICLGLTYTFVPLVIVSKLLKTQSMAVGNVNTRFCDEF